MTKEEKCSPGCNEWLPSCSENPNAFRRGNKYLNTLFYFNKNLDRSQYFKPAINIKDFFPPEIPNRTVSEAVQLALFYQTALRERPYLSRNQFFKEQGKLVSRARMTQVINLLRLHPRILEYLKTTNIYVSERQLRPLVNLPRSRQLTGFLRLPEVSATSLPPLVTTAD